MLGRFTAVSVALLSLTVGLQAQQVLSEALHTFPLTTASVEYENLATLRGSPKYAELRSQYFAHPLQELEEAFASAGIAPEEIDEIAIGARAERPAAAATYGVISGSFGRLGKGLIVARIADVPVACLPTERSGLCFISLDDVTVAFGTFSRLYGLLQTKQGLTKALAADAAATEMLLGRASTEPIRGIGVSSQLKGYLKTFLPTSMAAWADWMKLFSDVQSYGYGFSAGNKTQVRLELACKTQDGAATLRQLLATLAAVQNGAGSAAKVREMQVALSGSRVMVTMALPNL